MYVVFLAGGIASGKSTAARELERLGAWRIDLDQVSREVLEGGTETARAITEAFGADLVDPETGALDRARLAGRAFSSPERVRLLEAIELPAIRKRLKEALADVRYATPEPTCCVVEVPLLDRMADMLDLADEVLLVSLPLAERRVRAVGRGMTAADFDARAEMQPTDTWLRSHAHTIIDNDGTLDDLRASVHAWWDARAASGWAGVRGRGGAHGA